MPIFCCRGLGPGTRLLSRNAGHLLTASASGTLEGDARDLWSYLALADDRGLSPGARGASRMHVYVGNVLQRDGKVHGPDHGPGLVTGAPSLPLCAVQGDGSDRLVRSTQARWFAFLVGVSSLAVGEGRRSSLLVG